MLLTATSNSFFPTTELLVAAPVVSFVARCNTFSRGQCRTRQNMPRQFIPIARTGHARSQGRIRTLLSASELLCASTKSMLRCLHEYCHAIHARSPSTFLFIPLKGTLATLVKNGHGFVGGSDLDLHKIGLTVLTFRTGGAGAIDILPGRFAAQDVHVIGSAAAGVARGYIRTNGNPLRRLGRYRTRVRTGAAKEMIRH
jgi:hypothetical protein